MTQTLPHLIPWNELLASQQEILRSAIPNGEIVGIATPKTQSELAETIRFVQAENWQILPYGNGSKLDWGGLVQADRPILAICVDHLNQLIDHAVGDMTVTIEAGMRFADLQKNLAAAGQFLPIDPRFIDQATVGGVIATADSGSLRHYYSGVRDLVLGVSFVRSDGEFVKAGGRVVKNVAGYDLMKLLTGSYGTLGVIAQVTLRVYPIQPLAQTLVVTGAIEKLAQLTQTLLGSSLTPTTIDWLSASAMTDLGLGPEIGLILRFETVAESIAEQRKQVKAWVQQLDLSLITYPEIDQAELWHSVGAIGESGAIICKIGLKASETAKILPKIAAIVPHTTVIIHAGSGLGRLVLPSAEGLTETRSLCESTGGFLSILHAPIEIKQSIDVWGYTSNAENLMQAVKQQFDPTRILSPNRFIS